MRGELLGAHILDAPAAVVEHKCRNLTVLSRYRIWLQRALSFCSGRVRDGLAGLALDAGRVNVYERWRSREDLLAYRAGDGPELDDSIAVTAADVELHHISASEAP